MILVGSLTSWMLQTDLINKINPQSFFHPDCNKSKDAFHQLFQLPSLQSFHPFPNLEIRSSRKLKLVANKFHKSDKECLDHSTTIHHHHYYPSDLQSND